MDRQFKNPLFGALYDFGIPVWTRKDGWVSKDMGKRSGGANADASAGIPNVPPSVGNMGNVGGMIRPRGGMMGFSRINTRYRQG